MRLLRFHYTKCGVQAGLVLDVIGWVAMMSDFSISLSKVLFVSKLTRCLVLVIGPVTHIISGREVWKSQ